MAWRDLLRLTSKLPAGWNWKSAILMVHLNASERIIGHSSQPIDAVRDSLELHQYGPLIEDGKSTVAELVYGKDPGSEVGKQDRSIFSQSPQNV